MSRYETLTPGLAGCEHWMMTQKFDDVWVCTATDCTASFRFVKDDDLVAVEPKEYARRWKDKKATTVEVA